MKNSMLYLAVLFISFQTTNAQGWFSNNRVRGNGNLTSETRKVADYDQVAVNGSFDVELVSGEEGTLQIEAESNLMEFIITEVTPEGTLKIKTERNVNLNPTEHIKITVPVRTINTVSLSGSGEVISRDKIPSEDFNVNLSGSGEIALFLEAREINAAISGSGEMELEGKTSGFKVALSGSGDLEASNLEAEEVKAVISGSGDMNVFASEALKATVSGSGDITYSGNPKRQDFRTIGSGSVSKK